MARLTTNFDEGFDNTADARDPLPLGWTSEDFRNRDLEVRDAGPRGFVDDGFDGPGVARITGRGLQYRDVTKFGHTIETPFRGTITGREEQAGRFFLDFDFEVSARAFFRATRTNGDRDNFELFESLFQGRDVVDLNGVGDDEIDGFGGADVLRLGRGDDYGEGGRGADRLFGEAGDDILDGEGGNDRLFGGAGSDTLEGGRGRDILVGGNGADVFVYDGVRLGRDLVRDHEARDVISIDSRGVNGFDDLHVFTFRGDAAVRFNRTVIAFDGMDEADVTADMFEFL